MAARRERVALSDAKKDVGRLAHRLAAVDREILEATIALGVEVRDSTMVMINGVLQNTKYLVYADGTPVVVRDRAAIDRVDALIHAGELAHVEVGPLLLNNAVLGVAAEGEGAVLNNLRVGDVADIEEGLVVDDAGNGGIAAEAQDINYEG